MPALPYKHHRLWFLRHASAHAYVYASMKSTRNSGPRRTAAAGLLLLFTWSAVVPVLYRMDCVNSGRSVSSWFAPISCRGVEVNDAGKHVVPACCIFYKADAVNAPSVSAKHVDEQRSVQVMELVFRPVQLPHGERHSHKVLSDHGPPMALGQRLASLGFLRV